MVKMSRHKTVAPNSYPLAYWYPVPMLETALILVGTRIHSCISTTVISVLPYHLRILDRSKLKLILIIVRLRTNVLIRAI